MLLCYIQEHRDRIVFLQARLLELEKSKLNRFSLELNRLSREDVLTGLANRRQFNEVFQVEWDRARRERQPLSLLFVDIDYFKLFNDSHGHLEGDRVLAEVGLAMKSVLRRPGDVAARYGGEEFVVLLPATPEGGALEVAVQVHEAIEAMDIPHSTSLVAKWVTASVGVATLMPEPEMRSSQLIACADEALYAAKAAGRNCIVVADMSHRTSAPILV
jgi:diguanylate cyclase (GGDEF)-like protein